MKADKIGISFDTPFTVDEWVQVAKLCIADNVPIPVTVAKVLLEGYEAAVQEIESMLMDACDRSRCTNMTCHLDQASCSPKWRGPVPGREVAYEPPEH